VQSPADAATAAAAANDDDERHADSEHQRDNGVITESPDSHTIRSDDGEPLTCSCIVRK